MPNLMRMTLNLNKLQLPICHIFLDYSFQDTLYYTKLNPYNIE